MDLTIARSSRLPASFGIRPTGNWKPCFTVRTSRYSGAHLPSLTSNVSICEGPPNRFRKITTSALPRGFTRLAARTFWGATMGSNPKPDTVRAPSRNASRLVSLGISVGSIESSVEQKVQTIDHGPGEIFGALLFIFLQRFH